MIPLEDNVGDIVGKAQRGLGISDSELAEKAGASSQKIRELREGNFDELAVVRVAPVLGLSARQLCDLGQGQWQPRHWPRWRCSRNDRTPRTTGGIYPRVSASNQNQFDALRGQVVLMRPRVWYGRM